MDQNNIALELLVRSGNVPGVEKFAKQEHLEKAEKTEKVREAGVYSAIEIMWEEAEGGIDSTEVCRFFNQKKFTDYFSSTNNVTILEKIIDVLQAGTEASMEAYAQIESVNVLGIESLAGAIRRNIGSGNMKEKVTKLVNSGYSLVFCPQNIDSKAVNHYFPIIDEWRDFVNPLKIAEEAILEFNSYDPEEEFVSTALDKLVELTDKEIVSQLVYSEFRGSDDYNKFLESGKIDDLSKMEPEESSKQKLKKSIEKYERHRSPEYGVNILAETVSDDDKKYIAERMSFWFRIGKMDHLMAVVDYKDGSLYDHALAKEKLTEGIIGAARMNYFNKLGWTLKLPEYLIDTDNPDMAGVAAAYEIAHSEG